MGTPGSGVLGSSSLVPFLPDTARANAFCAASAAIPGAWVVPAIIPPNNAPVPTCSPTPSLSVLLLSAACSALLLAIWLTPPWPASSKTCVPMLAKPAFMVGALMGAASNLATNLPMAIAAGAVIAAAFKPAVLASVARASSIDKPSPTSLLNSGEFFSKEAKSISSTSLAVCWNAPPASMPPIRAAVPPFSAAVARKRASPAPMMPALRAARIPRLLIAPATRDKGPTPITEPTA